MDRVTASWGSQKRKNDQKFCLATTTKYKYRRRKWTTGFREQRSRTPELETGLTIKISFNRVQFTEQKFSFSYLEAFRIGHNQPQLM